MWATKPALPRFRFTHHLPKGKGYRVGGFFRLASLTSSKSEGSKSFVESTINQNRLPSDVRGAFGGEPHNRVGNFLRLADAAHWNIRRPILINFFQAHAGSQGASAG